MCVLTYMDQLKYIINNIIYYKYHFVILYLILKIL